MVTKEAKNLKDSLSKVTASDAAEVKKDANRKVALRCVQGGTRERP